jgi:uncharacterized membrane protein YccF (DUF307 family)
MRSCADSMYSCRWLASAYVLFGVAMVMSLVFIPFVPQALKLAL